MSNSTTIKEQLLSEEVEAKIAGLSFKKTVSYQLDMQLQNIKRFILSLFNNNISVIKLYIYNLNINVQHGVSTINITTDTGNQGLKIYLNLRFIDSFRTKLDTNHITEVLITYLSSRGFFSALSVKDESYYIALARNKKQYYMYERTCYASLLAILAYIAYLGLIASCFVVYWVFKNTSIYNMRIPALVLAIIPLILIPIADVKSATSIQSNMLTYNTAIPDRATIINVIDVDNWLYK